MSDSLHLYQLTLRRPTHTTKCVVGQFTPSKKVQDFVFANSNCLEVYRLSPDTGKVNKLGVQDTWSEIKGLDILRLPGSAVDLLVVTADSGKLTILKYNHDKNFFYPIVSEPHSKTGFRRTYPGEYLAVDPQNRAIMIAALERNKLVYKIHASDDSAIELSSPLESMSKKHLTLDLVALDTGFDNPEFASIECDYAEYESTRAQYDPDTSPLLLRYYEFDQALNHIVKRKSPKRIPASANKLIPVPQAFGGGVLVCCEGKIIYEARVKDAEAAAADTKRSSEWNRRVIWLPRRTRSDRVSILCSVVHRVKKNSYYILLQTNLGDLYNLTFAYNENTEELESIAVGYYDTLPLCHSLSVLKSGFLFANTANGNKLFYQIENLGSQGEFADRDDTEEATPEGSELLFTPRAGEDELENLVLVDFVETLNPIVASTFIKSTKQIVTLSSDKYIKVLTHGIPTSEIAESGLPFQPTSIFTSKLESSAEDEGYLVISSTLSSQTFVLSVGEEISEVTDSQFITTQPTIAVQQIGESSVIQVYPNGIRYVNTRTSATTDWYPPAGITIISASCNNEQVILGLSNREICYFEVDPTDFQLIEYQDRLEMPGGRITSVALANNGKSSFAVVGCSDLTITVLSLQPHNCLGTVTLQALSSNCHSMLMLDGELHMGLENGLYVKTQLDAKGNLLDTRTRYLGTKPVALSSITRSRENGVNHPAILAVSSKPWIGYSHQNKYKLTPLLGKDILAGASFYSEDIGGNSIVGITNNSEFVIFSLGDGESVLSLDEDFSIASIKLRYTPRRLVKSNSNKDKGGDAGAEEEEEDGDGTLYVLGSEFGTKSVAQPSATLEPNQVIKNAAADEETYEVSENPAWHSSIQLVDVFASEVVLSVELPVNERAISLAVVKFGSENVDHLIVGTTTSEKHYLYTFKLPPAGTSKQKDHVFLHKTEIDFPPNVLLQFQDKLLIGMSNYLRLYDLGQRQLLRKASSVIEHFKNITQIKNQGNGDRLVVGDVSASVSFVKYDNLENKFVSFADDTLKRQITSITSLDYNTVVGGDKFGNIFVSRISAALSTQAEEDWSVMKYQSPFLNGSANRFKTVCEYHLGDIPTSFEVGCLNIGGVDSVIYTGLRGSIGILLPFATEQEIDFFSKLQGELRAYLDYNFDDIKIDGNSDSNILGRDHLKYRSYYNPVRNVVDGDLIERFIGLSSSVKVKISNKLERTPRDIERRIMDMRNRSAF